MMAFSFVILLNPLSTLLINSITILVFLVRHPFLEMTNQNKLIGNGTNEKEKYCLAKEGEVYLVYLGYTNTSSLDLSSVSGSFEVTWFNPRTGESNLRGKVKRVKGGSKIELGTAPKNFNEDWLVVVKRK